MTLGKHVFTEGNYLINLTTKVRLPIDSDINILRENKFLAGQEEESIYEELFNNEPAKVRNINFKIIPTWQCNLRCSHCFVLHKLEAKHISKIDPQALSDFIQRISQYTPNLKCVGMTFLGGEPLLNHELCDAIINAMPTDKIEFKFGITTNGTILNKPILNLFQKLYNITISVDGPEYLHNIQRKSLTGIDPFETVCKNIRIMVTNGLRDKIQVQASIPGEHWNKTIIRDFIKEMLKCGIKYENIRYGTTVPTRQNPTPHNKFIESVKTKLLPSPCCKYRFGYDFVVDDGNSIYCDYFEDSEQTKIGTLYDDIDTIKKNMRTTIENSIPALKDPVCRSCPVVGVCWGWCCNVHNRLKPSELCDQKGIEEIVKAATTEGNLEYYFFNKDAAVIRELKMRMNQSIAQGGTGGNTPPAPAGKDPSS